MREYQRAIDPRAPGDQCVQAACRIVTLGQLKRTRDGRAYTFKAMLEVRGCSVKVDPFSQPFLLIFH